MMTTLTHNTVHHGGDQEFEVILDPYQSWIQTEFEVILDPSILDTDPHGRPRRGSDMCSAHSPTDRAGTRARPGRPWCTAGRTNVHRYVTLLDTEIGMSGSDCSSCSGQGRAGDASY